MNAKRRKKATGGASRWLVALIVAALVVLAAGLWHLFRGGLADQRVPLESRLVEPAAERGVGTEAIAADDSIRKVDGIFVRTWRIDSPKRAARDGFLGDLELMERQNNGESITLTDFDREVDDRRDVVLEPTASKPRAATSELQDEATVIHIEAVPEGAIQEVVKLIPENENLILDLRDHRWGLDEEAISHGDFAVLLLKAALGYTDTLPDPETALELVKGYGLVAEDWQVDTGLTHGELAEVLQRFGVVYLPADVDQPASRPYVEAMLRRELSRLRDYLARRLGHGFSVNHVLDQGVDRAVSSSTFD